MEEIKNTDRQIIAAFRRNWPDVEHEDNPGSALAEAVVDDLGVGDDEAAINRIYDLSVDWCELHGFDWHD